MIKVKNVFAKVKEDDGWRVLVDLFWPEGLKTRPAAVHQWYPKIGPSYDLQRFNFDVSKWEEYKQKYIEELQSSPEKKQILDEISKRAENETITLLFGNHDSQYNHAVILKELIENRK